MDQQRLVAMDDPHLAALQTTIRAENWSGSLEVRSGLDGRVRNGGMARYRGLAGTHLVFRSSGADGDLISPDVETATTSRDRATDGYVAASRLGAERALAPALPSDLPELSMELRLRTGPPARFP